ncbi:MAG: glycosyltransferase, partial [Thermoguttaceae bacterium]|nr:glycosyltransferase [Thermoguttaceae bacterium]
AKKLGGATVFTLHNLAYRRRELFEPFDAVVVPSEFARAHYQKALGVEAEVVPPIIDEAKVVVSQNTRRFATFVNPSPDKGGYFFVGIARELNRLRPDIPLLVVDSRSTVDSFKKSATARGLTNLYSLENVADPRAFYSQSRVVLVPSLCEESFGRVVVEAGFNGIPVLCSDRGALPEVCGVPELILPVSKRFDATSRVVPEPAETKLWVERIARLWDDEDYAQKKGAALRERVARYSQRRVEETTRRFLTRFARSTPSG